ncbi:MAG: aspartate/glutamate racemase family protein [Anaerolineae bacterium]|nr:aspartate/glutamate racemase family protein [Anaerolineae bacterium]
MRKTIGIIGGMSPESTLVYYEHIHWTYRAHHGDVNYPPVVIYSVPFADCRRWTADQAWEEAAAALGDAARRLHAAGADFALIATNTMHIAFESAQRRSPIPLLHIIDVTAEAILARGLTRVGLLGTTTTMQHPFYRDRLSAYGLTAVVPSADQQEQVSRIIYEELTNGEVRPQSKATYLQAIAELEAQGAQGVILGCTEIPLLIGQDDLALPVFDTTRLHAEAALAVALEERPLPRAGRGT